MEEVHVLEIEEVSGSYEYSQAEIYYKNAKYVKAQALLDQLELALKLNQPYTPGHVFVMRRKYACLIQ